MLHRRSILCRLVVLALFVTVQAGCEPALKSDSGSMADMPPAPTFDYAQFAHRYNQRVTNIDQLWAHVVVEVRWIDAEGNKHFEQGNTSTLIWRRPNDAALSIRHAGTNILYWIGCDAEQYWLFDLNPPDGQPTTVYFGRQDAVGRQLEHPLPVPIAPYQLVDLLAITPLPAQADEIDHNPDGSTVLTYPLSAAGYFKRMLVAKDADRPQRIILFKTAEAAAPPDTEPELAAAEIVAEAEYSRWTPMELDGRPLGAWPDVPGRIQIFIPAHQATISLGLSQISDGKRREKVHDFQFNLDVLTTRLKPERHTNLDTMPAPEVGP